MNEIGYDCDNFADSKCLCHKGGTGCLNLQVINLLEHLSGVVNQLSPSDAKMFCDKIIVGVNDLKKGVK